MIISDRSSKVALVEGYVNWLRSAALRGAKLYYVNFMFEELNCPKQDLIHRMTAIIEAIKCSPSENEATSGMSVGRSVSVARRASSKSTLRDAIAEKMQKRTERASKAN